MRALTLAFTLMLPTIAFGKQAPPVQRYDFDNDVVEGTTKTPDGDTIMARNKSESKSLIRLRQDFRRELLKSAESI